MDFILSSGENYDSSEIDFVVADVMPCDAWFVIPVEAIPGPKTACCVCKGTLGAGSWGNIGSVGIDDDAMAGE